MGEPQILKPAPSTWPRAGFARGCLGGWGVSSDSSVSGCLCSGWRPHGSSIIFNVKPPLSIPSVPDPGLGAQMQRRKRLSPVPQGLARKGPGNESHTLG